MEIIDLRKAEPIHSITGLGNPKRLGYFPESGRLIVANDKDGLCNRYDGESFDLTGSVNLKDDADDVRCDATRAYVGFGRGGVAVIDPQNGKLVRSFETGARPEAFVLEKNGPRIFANVPDRHEVAVIDRDEGKVVARWATGAASANLRIGFDEARHRLVVGCRSPAKLVVLDSDSGAVVTSVSIPPDPDDLFFDEKKHRLSVICGAGLLAVIEQIDANSYRCGATIPTARGARTGLFIPEQFSLESVRLLSNRT